METEGSLLDLLRAELKKQLAETMGLGWQTAVKELGARAGREYDVALSFSRCLDSAFELIRRFPSQFDKWAGKTVLAPAPETDREKTARYLAEQAEERRLALLERAAPGAEEIVAAAVAKLPWRREREPLRRSA